LNKNKLSPISFIHGINSCLNFDRIRYSAIGTSCVEAGKKPASVNQPSFEMGMLAAQSTHMSRATGCEQMSNRNLGQREVTGLAELFGGH
jgi:hypothetical protein